MENVNENVIDKLNNLIALLEDGKMGYENAANDVKDISMKNLFMRFSQEREQYISQLQQEVGKLYGKPEDNGGPIGALHRIWMDLKSVFTSGDKEAMVNACITGEEAAIKQYREVLEETDFSSSIKQILSNQLRGIESALGSIKSQVLAPTA